jgi:rare lipoprotein A (peptidoglycan hydrolase)
MIRGDVRCLGTLGVFDLKPGATGSAAGAARAAFGVIAACCLLSGCSSAFNVVPTPQPVSVALAPADPPPQPQEIVAPLPTLASLPTPQPTVQSERRHSSLKIGKPYQVAGNWYYPAPGNGYDQEGIASWYGPDFHGKSTANGEIYNQNRLTAAHPTLPMPCYVAVTNQENGRTLVVRVNDRGPYKPGRIIDLSHRAAQLLGVTHAGTANVRVKYLKAAPLLADERFEQAFLARQTWYHGPQLASVESGAAPARARLRLGPLVSGWQPDTAATQ